MPSDQLAFEGPERELLLEELVTEARRQGAPVPYSANAPYLNTFRHLRRSDDPGRRESSTGSGR